MAEDQQTIAIRDVGESLLDNTHVRSPRSLTAWALSCVAQAADGR